MSLSEGRVKRCRNVRRQLLPNLEAVISWVKCRKLCTLINTYKIWYDKIPYLCFIMNDQVVRILQKFSFESLNDLQHKALAAYKGHKHVKLISPTGSGKTIAYLLPALLDASAHNKKILVIAPSRELVLQIENVARTMALGLKINVCYGGHPSKIEANSLQGGYQCVIGTPGRIADHLRRENMKADDFHIMILDEYDKSLEIGFHEEMMEIVAACTQVERYILTSATEAVPIPSFIPIKHHETIVDTTEHVKPKLKYWLVTSAEKDKLPVLGKLLQSLQGETSIVFCNYKESVERVYDYLRTLGIPCDYFHGGLEQRERELALAKYRNGSTAVLVCTDLAARGIDISHVRHVIHYHFSFTEDEYTHRNGRTARMGASGNIYLLRYEAEDLPEYITAIPSEYYLKEISDTKPLNHEWTTLHLNKGKKDKINKVDVVGYLYKGCGLEKDDVGNIEIKDLFTLVAIQSEAVSKVFMNYKKEKLKGKVVQVKTI
jgi:superfamily II DNA/RNA helicase